MTVTRDARARRNDSIMRAAILVAMLAWTSLASAHVEAGRAEGLLAGLHHPISGLDHVLAMVAVGLWGAQLGAPAIWLLPVTFPDGDGVRRHARVCSACRCPASRSASRCRRSLLGLAVSAAWRPPLWAAAVVVGLFAIFHGHAHGTELPVGASGLTYSLGFVAATGLLHAAGIGIGTIHRWPRGRLLLRTAGVAVAAAGAVFLWRALA